MREDRIYFLKEISTGKIVASFPNGTNKDITKWAMANGIKTYYHAIECPGVLERQGYRLELYKRVGE